MRRRYYAALVAAIVLVAAYAKRNDSRQAAAAAPAGVLAALPRAQTGERLPDWVQESPHFFSRDGRRLAAAVGSAHVDNPALARAVATDRARADLLRLIKGGAAAEALTGALPGARVTDTFTSKTRGRVFVRVEIEETR